MTNLDYLGTYSHPISHHRTAPHYFMKVSATIKGRTDSHGRRPIFLRISHGEKRSFMSTGLRINPKDFKKGRVQPSHPDHLQLNRKILNLIIETEKAGGFVKEKTEVLTFNDFAVRLFNSWDKQKHWDTIRHYQSSLNKFNDFATGIPLADVSPQTLEGFLNYCYALGNKSNTVWSMFRFVRLIIRRAVKEGKIITNPFNLFEMPKYKDPKKTYLTDAQIKAIDKLRTAKVPKEIQFAATWFVIGCYTGLRYGDMKAFDKKKNVRNGRLIVYTGKTGEVVGMPISKKLTELFSSIDYRPLNLTNEYYNRLLKQVQGLADIEETLTAHVSRHTAAVRWADAGISIEVVAKLLGHRNLRTAAIYFKVTDKRIDDELLKLK